jgi:hypothetical protein
MGKTFELRAEIERLRAVGAHLAEIDLGEFTESADLRETIREKVNIGTPTAELTVAFDVSMNRLNLTSTASSN